MRVAIDLMVKVPALSCPCWKICVCVKWALEELKNVSIGNPPQIIKNLNIINERKFKDQPLTAGWLVESHTEKEENWVIREAKDYEDDLHQSIADLLKTLQSRYTNCVSDMCNYLTAIDLENLFCLLVGEWLNGVSKAEHEEYGREFFKKFIEYICGQKQVAAIVKDRLLEID